MEKIIVKYFDKSLPKIEPIVNGDWIDLRTMVDVTMHPNEFYMIPLGVAMVLPKGYEALVVPRSSTYKKYGLIMTNSIGVIDNSYNGDNDMWRMPVICLPYTGMCRQFDGSIFIPKGTRLCQFRIVKNQPDLMFKEVDILGNKDRGGFGSTGEV